MDISTVSIVKDYMIWSRSSMDRMTDSGSVGLGVRVAPGSQKAPSSAFLVYTDLIAEPERRVINVSLPDGAFTKNRITTIIRFFSWFLGLTEGF